MVNPLLRRVDVDAGENGVWLDNFLGWPGVWVRARGLDSRAAQDYRRALVGQIYGDEEYLVEDAAIRDYLNARVLADVCVLDIRGWTDAALKPLAYSPALASTMMFRPRTATPATPDGLDYDPAAKEILELFTVAAFRAAKMRENAEKKQPPVSFDGAEANPPRPATGTETARTTTDAPAAEPEQNPAD